jgi:hypothetical protein
MAKDRASVAMSDESEGDIIYESDDHDGSGTRSGQLSEHNIWPNYGKNIPYDMSQLFSESASDNLRMVKKCVYEHLNLISGGEEKKTMLCAMEGITVRTSGCITFKQRTDEEDYIHFQKGLYVAHFLVQAL